MRFKDYLVLARNSLFHRKLRSWLTVLGIIIGIAAVVAMISITQGFGNSIKEQLSAFGGNSIFISPGKQQQSNAQAFSFTGGGFASSATQGKLTSTDVAFLKGIRGVDFVDGMITGREDAVFRGENIKVTIEGATPDLWRIFNIITLEKGRFFFSTESRAVVVGNSIAKKIFKNEIKVGDIIKIKGTDFRVVGVLQAGSGISSSIFDNALIIPREDARRIFLEPGSKEVSAIIIKGSDNADMDQVTKDVELRLRASHKKAPGEEDFTVTNSKAIQGRVDQIIASQTIFIGGIAAISLFVGAIGIANTMFMSVIERTKQIGILKALGAKNNDIMNIFLVESSLLGLVGGIIGVVLGSLLGIGIAGIISGSSFGLKVAPAITLELIAFAVIFSVVIGAISGLLPSRRASKLEPVEALRYE